jgi:hypothetical protein
MAKGKRTRGRIRNSIAFTLQHQRVTSPASSSISQHDGPSTSQRLPLPCARCAAIPKGSQRYVRWSRCRGHGPATPRPPPCKRPCVFGKLASSARPLRGQATRHLRNRNDYRPPGVFRIRREVVRVDRDTFEAEDRATSLAKAAGVESLHEILRTRPSDAPRPASANAGLL